MFDNCNIVVGLFAALILGVKFRVRNDVASHFAFALRPDHHYPRIATRHAWSQANNDCRQYAEVDSDADYDIVQFCYSTVLIVHFVWSLSVLTAAVHPR